MITQLRSLLPGPARRRYDIALALMALSGVLQGVAFVLLLPVLRALFSDDPSNAWPWVVMLLVVTVVYVMATWLAVARSQRTAIELIGVLHRRLGDAVARLPIGTVDLAMTGRLSRLTSKGVMQVATVPAHYFRPISAAVLAPTTVVAGIALIDWRIGLVVVACLPLLALAYKVTTVVVGRRNAADAGSISEASARIVEFARVQPALRAFGGTGATGDAVQQALVRQHEARRNLLVGGAAGMSAFVLAVQAAVTLLIVTSLYFAFNSALDVPTLIALLVLGLRFAEPITSVADLGSGLRVSADTLQEIREILAIPVLPEPEGEKDAPHASGIEVRNVSFGYREGATVLQGVSFSVPPGTTTAIVGPSGAGKTTMLKLIARFYDVGEGAVLIGGRDVRELGTEATMSVVSPVFQDVFLFSGSLVDNIRMGRPDASEAEVLDAGRAAAVDEIAARLRGGWDAQVGEGGSRLSGGERQRVSIARAILKDAPVLLLDEATSALDPLNENVIMRALNRLSDRTRVVVAHRLSTIREADQIVVLDENGRVAEVGKHDVLLSANGRYAAFWRMREQSQGWTLIPTSGMAAERS